MRRTRCDRPHLEVTGGFLLLSAWLLWADVEHLLPMTLCAAALHELGHWAAIRAFGGRVLRLRLSAVGAEMQVGGMPGYRAEMFSALAGPAVNLLAALAMARVGSERCRVFAGIHLALAVFNLLPVSVLDGGRCLLALAGLLSDSGVPDGLRRGMDAAATALLLTAGAAAYLRTGNLTGLIMAGWVALRTWKRDLPRRRETAKMG